MYLLDFRNPLGHLLRARHHPAELLAAIYEHWWNVDPAIVCGFELTTKLRLNMGFYVPAPKVGCTVIPRLSPAPPISGIHSIHTQ